MITTESRIDSPALLKDENDDLRKTNQRVIAENRALKDELYRLRKPDGILSQESFDECYGESEFSIEEYELGKMVLKAVQAARHKLRAGEPIYMTIDIPQWFKTTGDLEFADLTAMRVFSPDRTKVAYEITPG